MRADYLFTLLGGIGILGILLVCAFAIAFVVLFVIGQYKLFKKAGKQGWEAIIPFYSTWVLVEIAGLNWWWFLLAVAKVIVSMLGGLAFLGTVAKFIANFCIYYNLAKKFRKEPILYGVLGMFFGDILIMILGYSNSMEYDSSVEVTPNGVFDGNNSNNNTTNNNFNNNSVNNTGSKFCTNCGSPISNNEHFCPKCGQKVD